MQARAVVDGLPGDIVALALPLDIMKIEEAGLIKPGWQVSASHSHLLFIFPWEEFADRVSYVLMLL